MQTKLINLFGPPSAGKSTLAFQLVGLMKSCGVLAEYAPEAMKYHIYRGTADIMAKHQDRLLQEQIDNVSLFYGKVEVIVTDSPILMQMAYHTPENSTEWTKPATLKAASFFDRINILLLRNHPYDPRHRFQTEEEAHEKHYEILDLLNEHERNNYHTILSGPSAAGDVLKIYRNAV